MEFQVLNVLPTVLEEDCRDQSCPYKKLLKLPIEAVVVNLFKCILVKSELKAKGHQLVAEESHIYFHHIYFLSLNNVFYLVNV